MGRVDLGSNPQIYSTWEAALKRKNSKIGLNSSFRCCIILFQVYMVRYLIIDHIYCRTGSHHSHSSCPDKTRIIYYTGGSF